MFFSLFYNNSVLSSLYLLVPTVQHLHVTSVFFLFFQALSDIQIAVKMVQSNVDSDEHPLDRQYHSLQCKLEPLESSSREYKVCVLVFISVILVNVKVYTAAMFWGVCSRFIWCKLIHEICIKTVNQKSLDWGDSVHNISKVR